MMLRMILGAAALFGAASATAQTAAPPGAARTFDPAAIAEAREMLRETGFEATFQASVMQSGDSSFTTVMREMEAHHGRDFPDDLEDRIRRLMRSHLERLVTDMQPTALEDSARVYARYFTAEELRELRRLQIHPVMVKFQGIAPQFMNELMQVGIAASARRLPELMEDMRRELDAWLNDPQRRPAPTG